MTKADLGFISTGERQLDWLLGGGFPKGSTVLLTTPPSASRSFLLTFASAALKQSLPVVYVAVDEPCDRMRERLKDLGYSPQDLEQEKLLTFVDCFSCRGNEASKERYAPSGLSQLSDLSLVLAAAVGDVQKVFRRLIFGLFDSLTTLVLASSFEDTFKLAQIWLARAVLGKSVLICYSRTGILSTQPQNILESLFDIHLTDDGQSAFNFLRLSSARRDIIKCRVRYRPTPFGFKLLLDQAVFDEIEAQLRERLSDVREARSHLAQEEMEQTV